MTTRARIGLSSFPAICLVMLALAGGPVHAGTMSASPTPPVVTSNDIANYGSVTGQDKWFGPNLRKGQTFTTGRVPVLFKSISYFMFEQGAAPTKTYTVRVGTFSGDTFTPMYSDTFTQAFMWNRGEYMTWTFGEPVRLAANTTYGVEIEMAASTSSWQTGIPYICVSSDIYAGGQIYGYGANENATEKVSRALNPRLDRIFHLDLQDAAATSPEPVVHVPPGNAYANGTITPSPSGRLPVKGSSPEPSGPASAPSPGKGEPRASSDELVLNDWRRGPPDRPDLIEASVSPIFDDRAWTSAVSFDQLQIIPNKTVSFRTHVRLDAAWLAKMKKARLLLTKINPRGVIYVNGWKVGETGGNSEKSEFSLNSLLRVGDNVITIIVTTAGGAGHMAKDCRIAP